MTTVAWDGVHMACDAMTDLGGFKYPAGPKIWRLADGSLFGGAGSKSQVHAMRAWLEGGPEPDAYDDIHALHVPSGGEARFFANSLQPTPVNKRIFAVGSGRDFAMAAMHCGRSAEEAVGVACEYDTYSAGPVTVLALATSP